MNIDLRTRFSSDYRVTCEESCDHRHHNDQCDAHYAVIPCRFGHIYLHGGNTLGAATNSRGPTAKRLATLPCVRTTQDGDDGVNVVFDVDDFDAVAAVMRPKRRRRLSPEHRAKLVAMGTANLKRARNAQSNDAGSALETLSA